MTYKFIFFIMLASFFAACKKYPEGGISLFKKEELERDEGQTRHYWGVRKFEVNGVDSTDYIVSNGDPEIRTKYIWFFKTRSESYVATIYSGAIANFGLSKDKRILGVGSINGYGATEYGRDTSVKVRRVIMPYKGGADWEILRFKTKEMVLRSEGGGNVYILELKRQD
jgi:hypothetical protein